VRTIDKVLESIKCHVGQLPDAIVTKIRSLDEHQLESVNTGLDIGLVWDTIPEQLTDKLNGLDKATFNAIQAGFEIGKILRQEPQKSWL